MSNLPIQWKKQATENLIQFGRGNISQHAFWNKTCLIIKHGIGLMDPPPYEYWKEQSIVRKPILGIEHPNASAAFHYKTSAFLDKWEFDMLISCLHKMIRRSCFFDAVWAACRIMQIGLFHSVTNLGTTELWTIFPAAQSKMTNIINRLIVVTAEDFFPSGVLFYEITLLLELARKNLFELKQPQTEELYMKRFYKCVKHVLTVVSTLISLPKQHYIGCRMFKFGVDTVHVSVEKKRKQSDIRTLFSPSLRSTIEG
jgi:hypothetical protein